MKRTPKIKNLSYLKENKYIIKISLIVSFYISIYTFISFVCLNIYIPFFFFYRINIFLTKQTYNTNNNLPMIRYKDLYIGKYILASSHARSACDEGFFLLFFFIVIIFHSF